MMMQTPAATNAFFCEFRAMETCQVAGNVVLFLLNAI